MLFRRLSPLVLLVGLLAGCHGKPFYVITDSRFRTELPPHREAEPVRPVQVSPGPCDGRRIAIIDVDGLLVNANMTGLLSAGENPVAIFREKLEHIARSTCYCGVVLRINSPGGGVTACDIMRRDLLQFRAQTGLPVIACLMDVGAGGAYYLATGANQIVAHPTTITGGIGVILNLYNLQDTMAQANVEGTPIKAGEYTDLGTPIHALDEKGEEILQQVADEFHARFRDAVRQSRSIQAADDADMFDGRVFTATQAAQLRLVDSIGYLDDALLAARQLSNCPDASVVLLHRPRDPAHTVYDVTPNTPMQTTLIPFSVPGLDRSRLPTFLYLWQPEPTLERLGGK